MFAQVLSDAIEARLTVQKSDSFFLARAAQDAPGYLTKDEWYWVLRVSDSDSSVVGWVSDAFHVYSNATTDFALSKRDIRMLATRAVPPNRRMKLPAKGSSPRLRLDKC